MGEQRVTISASRARTGGRPTRAESARRLEHLLDVAAKSFLSHGYGATTIEAVARGSGIAKKTIYRRFGDKAALFGAVLRRLFDRWFDVLGEVAVEDDALPGTLRAYARHVLAGAVNQEGLMLSAMIQAEARAFPHLAQGYYENGPARIQAMLARFLAEQHAAGRVRIEDPDVAAEQFLHLAIGGIHRRAMLGIGPTPDQDALDRRADFAVRVFLDGCRAIADDDRR
ncbi:MAG TPA: TetR/AcrR family transcriptional regulator [Aliidongia sp.]|uniref:TetR/AcrR family transcriptional regulator n=1 Tax=Aliidongia sp. TaxID=1914230 RepID=UPI002DDCF343|nr:TetR/AcrR family transcriptional regulator [Aliidongia sp.]HEV2678209.1 TetR/AcrR family transcriptional regulator [Aliidongia sp.]